jgi:hypothetical protein
MSFFKFKPLLPGQTMGEEDREPSFTLRVYTSGGAVVIDYDLLIIGDPAGPHVEISQAGIKVMDAETVLGFWQTDGDIFIGQDIDDPAETYLAIFATAQNYNSETVAAGDMLIGDNSSGEANLYFDKSSGTILFRGGTSAAAYIATNGAIVAGDGEVVLDETGVSISLPTTIQREGKHALKFKLNTAVVSSITGRATTGTGATSRLEVNAGYSSALANATAVAELLAGDVDAPDYSGVRVTAKLGNSAGHLVETIINDLLLIEVNESAVKAKKNLVSEEHLTLYDQAGTPTDPGSSSEGNLYIKDGLLIAQYNDAGTVRYKYLDLTGTGVTWVHTTTGP